MTLPELAGILQRAGIEAHDLRPATSAEQVTLGFDGCLWISFKVLP